MKVKKLFLAATLIVALTMTGCGQGVLQEDSGTENQGTLENQEQKGSSDEEKEAVFVLNIVDVFALTGRGTVVAGTVKSGGVKIGDTVYVVKEDGTELETSVVRIEVFGGMKDEAGEGENVGIELDGLEKDQIAPGDQLVGYWSS